MASWTSQNSDHWAHQEPCLNTWGRKQLKKTVNIHLLWSLQAHTTCTPPTYINTPMYTCMPQTCTNAKQWKWRCWVLLKILSNSIQFISTRQSILFLWSCSHQWCPTIFLPEHFLLASSSKHTKNRVFHVSSPDSTLDWVTLDHHRLLFISWPVSHN